MIHFSLKIVLFTLSTVLLAACSNDVKVYSKKEVITDTTNLKTAIKHKKTITHLDLSNQGLTEFPKEISEMKQLIFLDISGNHISKIEGDFEALDKLLYIDLSENDLTDVPASFASFKKLDHLHLENNKIQVVRTNLTEFPALLEIDLSWNPLIEFPRSAIASKSIKQLDLFQTFITAIPKEISKNASISDLWLPSKINRKDLPLLDSLMSQNINVQHYSFAKSLAEEQNITIYDNIEITSISKDSIRYLDLSRRNYAEIPQKVLQYKNLEFIDLSGNTIKELNEILLKLPKLKSIDLSGNNISTVDIALLPKNLILLDLSGNEISKDLKASNFPELEYLFLEKNALSSIDLKQVPKLKIADFSMNPNLKNIKISAGNLKILGLPSAYEEKAISAESLFYR